MKYLNILIIVVSLYTGLAFAQYEHTIMTYNILNFPLTDTTSRNLYFRQIFSSIQPDILVVEEIASKAAADSFMSKILNKSSSGYQVGTFINGPDLDAAIFYKASYFTFISNVPIHTTLRDINEFRLKHNATNDTLIIYSVHLKASNTSQDSLQRAAEVDSLRKRTNSLPPNSNYIVLGDFNIYSSNESAYQKLKNQSSPGYFIDPFSLNGVWNNSAYSIYHTQSTRTRSFGDGSTGGLDDRFDMILMSPAVMEAGGITYVPGSYRAYGNDGNHYNDSINKMPNTAVTQQVANALHYASDHLPVYASFSFSSDFLDLTSFRVLIEGFYNGNSMTADTVNVELHSSIYPYSLVDQTKVLLNSSGSGNGKFYNSNNSTPYYIVVKHRNSIETWSSSPQVFINNSLTYDFTTSSNKAFGNNLKLVNGNWCIYSGDVNQDGVVNFNDVDMVYNNNISGNRGYYTTDITGDNYTDISDLTLVFINKISGITKKRP